MPKLRRPHAEAKPLLEKQLLLADDFLDRTKLTSEEALNATQAEFSAWEDYTETLLENLFDTKELATEFAHDDISVFVGRDTLDEKIIDFEIDVEHRKRRLNSIVERLELFEESRSEEIRVRENSSEETTASISEPPDYIKHLLWVFQRETWKNHPIPAVIVSLVFLAGIIGTGYGLATAFWPDSGKNDLVVTKVRPITDQISTIDPFANTATVSLVWELVLSNNGESRVSIIDYDAKQLTDYGANDYTGMNQGIFQLENNKLAPLNFPFTLESGNSMAVFVRLGVMLDEKTWNLLEPHTTASPLTSRAIFDILKNSETDIFGNPFVKLDSGAHQLPKLDDLTEPAFGVTFETSKDVTVSEFVSWYRYGLFREMHDGE